ncbi:MAG: insulinase family protein [Phycisphaerales bacterium]
MPDATPATIGKGLTFFADVTSALSLLPQEIDAERPDHPGRALTQPLPAGSGTSDYVLERIAPGSIFGFREPIGTEQTIDSVREADFRDYYGKWYGASNATVMVVADADPAEVVKVVKERFASAAKHARGRRRRPVNAEGVRPFVRDRHLRSRGARGGASCGSARRAPPVVTEEQYRDGSSSDSERQRLNRHGDKVAARAELPRRPGLSNGEAN